MRGGCTIPPWPRFPRPPDNPGRPNFSRSGLEPWPILHEPSQTPRGLSADSHTPHDSGLPTASFHLRRRLIPTLCPDIARMTKPPSVQSPFAPRPVLPARGRRVPPPGRALPHRLRSYGLMRRSRHLTYPSAHRLVRGVFAGCYQPRLLAGSSRRYCLRVFPRMPEPMSRRSPVSSAFPKNRSGRLPASFRERDFSRGRFRDCSYFLMFRPPSLLASRIAPTAVSFPTGQLRRLHPSRTCVVAFARIGYAIGRLQAINRTGTLTPLDSQFCRLPPIPIARSLTHDDSTVL